jgi:sulfonate transport system substrate-binding protein
VTVEWTEFPAGPQLLEAMNVGSIDFAITGETPPIFGQAAGTPLVYVGYEPPSPAGEAIVVPQDSPITSVAELAGKRVALNKGSNVHYLLVRALEEAGLTIKDVELAYLPPADARAAFDRGAIDGWVIWDPFYAVAETAAGARTLRNGEGLVKNHIFYFGTRQSLETAPESIVAVLQELRDLGAWYRPNVKEAITILEGETGVDPASLERAFGRLNLGVQPLTAEVVAEQQRIAEVFYDLGIVPKRVEVAEAVSFQSF